MPLISLSTNAKFDSEDAKKAFVSDFSKFCATTVGKEEKYFNIDVHFNPYLTFGGTFELAIMLKIVSLDNVNPTNSKVWAKEFSTFFEKKLGVPNDRGLMAFQDPGPAYIGWRGTTVGALREASTE
ncbi:Tautomerase/MIF superfamily [Boletus coccyginus]|nr:Tautomerase/MIF superfamily [Boletus coccyginus]